MRRKHTVHARVLIALDRGGGLRLSYSDVLELAKDGALFSRGNLDLECFAAGHDPRTCSSDTCEEL